MQTRQLYADVTQKIIADLEQGCPTWLRPWKGGQKNGIMPINVATHRAHSGINIPILWYAAAEQCFPTNEWMTFKQAKAIDGVFRKDEKGTHIVFTKPFTVIEDEEEKTRRMLATFTVFNICQIDGIAIRPEPLVELPPVEERLQAFVDATGAKVQFGGDRAYYSPSHDLIVLPKREDFFE